MTVLSQPRNPLIETALQFAKTWCDGHVIDEAPALAHAVKVATTLGDHIAEAPAELIAAALLHDAPYFAPHDIDLDRILTDQLGPQVTRTVRALEREHAAMDESGDPHLNLADRWTLYASAADKIVAIGSILRRAARADDTSAYWQHRTKFISRIGYFITFCDQAGPLLPAGMRDELGKIVDRASHVTAGCRRR